MQNGFEKFFRHEVIYRTESSSNHPAVFSSGFMLKKSQHDWLNRPETHYVTVYVLHGSGVYITGNGEKIPLNPGKIFQRFPGVVHSTITDPASDYCEVFIALSPDFFRVLNAAKSIKNYAPVLDVGLNLSILDKFNAVFNAMKKSGGNDSQALLLSHHLINEIFEISECRTPLKPHNDSLKNACIRLEKAVLHPESLHEIAQKSNLSYENFRKLFKTRYGMSPKAFMTNKKIETACKMLKESELSIKEISDLLNYSDIHSFSKQFTQKTGKSPSFFRRFG